MRKSYLSHIFRHSTENLIHVSYLFQPLFLLFALDTENKARVSALLTGKATERF